jgi:hypothetical protein
MLLFCDRTNIRNLLASEFDFLKNRAFSEKIALARLGKKILTRSAGFAAIRCDISAG